MWVKARVDSGQWTVGSRLIIFSIYQFNSSLGSIYSVYWNLPISPTRMKVKKFEDLIVWQKSIEITVEIYRHFERHHDFGYSNQIRRASISISNNIAEGYERNSKKDFNRFLYIAKGSCSEVKSMLFLGNRLGYFSDLEIIHFYSRIDEIGKMLYGLSNSLNTTN